MDDKFQKKVKDYEKKIATSLRQKKEQKLLFFGFIAIVSLFFCALYYIS